MSDTMKTLTIFSAILLPLTFISSIYGMNGLDLQNMFTLSPGFVTILAVMAAITIGLFIYFKKKQWILTGSDALLSGAHVNKSKVKSNSKRSGPSSNASENVRDSFEGYNDNKKLQHENYWTTNSLDPGDAVAKGSANKIRRTET
jgi:hypothetical protein